MEKLKVGDKVEFIEEFKYGALAFIVGATDGSSLTLYPVHISKLIEVGILQNVPAQFIKLYEDRQRPNITAFI